MSGRPGKGKMPGGAAAFAGLAPSQLQAARQCVQQLCLSNKLSRQLAAVTQAGHLPALLKRK